MARNTVVLHGINCIVLECGTCGVPFTMPEVVYNAQVEEGGFHTCPNGHSRGWDKSRSQREAEIRDIARLRQSVAQKDDEIDDLKAQASKLKGETARILKRSSAGICPCCHRTFRQMAAHMKSKHPGYNVIPMKVAK